ncbi:hypothetical protein PC116_g3569 [Phytophthora cactorum]|nr:hypothetical protein Pcac1_g7557 [Phytophthora cactorum]KAG4248772.1 hypothetical protein PC116_g3569 [Phytophthora cactorum]
MDHNPALPRSHKWKTELLLWIDLFTGYVLAKASASRTAQTIAENYEECVFCWFGASEAIRHDRKPGFMSDFFRAFNRIVGQRQRVSSAGQRYSGMDGADADESTEAVRRRRESEALGRVRGALDVRTQHGS